MLVAEGSSTSFLINFGADPTQCYFAQFSPTLPIVDSKLVFGADCSVPHGSVGVVQVVCGRVAVIQLITP